MAKEKQKKNEDTVLENVHLEDRNRDGSKITLRYILEKKNSKVGSVEK
jgi:hypothetical protein